VIKTAVKEGYCSDPGRMFPGCSRCSLDVGCPRIALWKTLKNLMIRRLNGAIAGTLKAAELGDEALLHRISLKMWLPEYKSILNRRGVPSP
jgi:hypothetical protein